jgi:hypothetical protein
VFDCRVLTARDCASCVEEIMKQLGLGIIVAVGLTLPAFGQGVDPLLGTWKLNVEKSVSSPFKTATMVIAGEGQNRTLAGDGVDAQGQPFHGVLQHIYDGQLHPSTGDPSYDASAYARIGNTVNIVRFKNGKPIEVGQAILIPGKTYTHTYENDRLGHVVLVWEKQ